MAHKAWGGFTPFSDANMQLDHRIFTWHACVFLQIPCLHFLNRLVQGDRCVSRPKRNFGMILMHFPLIHEFIYPPENL